MITSISLSIPPNSKPEFLKKIGDLIHVNDDVASIFSEQNEIEIDIAEDLKISPKNVSSFLVKNIGDPVDLDEVIARKKSGIFFKKTIEVKSRFRGKIFELDNFSGRVKIVGVSSQQNLKSPVSGKIKDLNDKEIIIEFKGEEIKPTKFFGKTFFAPVAKISKINEEVDNDLMTTEMSGCILLGGHFSVSDVNKAMALGVRGILASKISDAVFDKFKDGKIISIDDRERKISFSIAVCDADSFLKLEKISHQKQLYFDGSGGKIIIPHE